MLHNHPHLARRQDLLAAVVTGVGEFAEEHGVEHPFAELVAGRMRLAVGEVTEGELLQAIGADDKIFHRFGVYKRGC